MVNCGTHDRTGRIILKKDYDKLMEIKNFYLETRSTKNRISLFLCFYIFIFIIDIIFGFIFYNFNMEVIFFFTIAIIFLLETIRKIRYTLEFISPLFTFTIISFIAFPIKYLYYSFASSKLFFVKEHFLIGFDYTNSDFRFTLLIFVIGYFSFVIGYKTTVFRKITSRLFSYKGIYDIKPKLSNLMVLLFLIMLCNYVIQFKFNIGRIFGNSIVSIPLVSGLVYYIFSLSLNFLLPIYLYIAIKQKKSYHFFVAILMFLLLFLFSIMNLSKSGLIYPILVCIIVSILIKEKIGKLPRNVFYVTIVLIAFLTIMFPIIATLREATLNNGLIGGQESIVFLNEGIKSNTDSSEFFVNKAISALFTRIAGFDVLLPLAAYNRDNDLLNGNDFLNLIFGKQEKDYFDMYRIILGVPLTNNSGFEITFFGFLYMYFRIYGVAVGMFLWGVFIRILNDMVIKISSRSDVLASGIWPVFIYWFFMLTFGFGPNAGSMAIKTLIAFVFIFLFWKRILRKI